jgi:hypothetical protein
MYKQTVIMKITDNVRHVMAAEFDGQIAALVK